MEKKLHNKKLERNEYQNINIVKTDKNIKTLAEFKGEHYGKIGTAKRDKLDKGFEAFRHRFEKTSELLKTSEV